MNHPPEPTAEQCSARATLRWGNIETLAIWYPQMGGYTGKAVVVDPYDTGDIDVYVWHDGQFPFRGSDLDLNDELRNPVKLHHCDVSQFKTFAEQIMEWL